MRAPSSLLATLRTRLLWAGGLWKLTAPAACWLTSPPTMPPRHGPTGKMQGLAVQCMLSLISVACLVCVPRCRQTDACCMLTSAVQCRRQKAPLLRSVFQALCLCTLRCAMRRRSCSASGLESPLCWAEGRLCVGGCGLQETHSAAAGQQPAPVRQRAWSGAHAHLPRRSGMCSRTPNA